MVTELIRAVNCFTGKFKQPIKLEILDMLTGCYNIDLYEQIFFYHPKNYPYETWVQLPKWFHTEKMFENFDK